MAVATFLRVHPLHRAVQKPYMHLYPKSYGKLSVAKHVGRDVVLLETLLAFYSAKRCNPTSPIVGRTYSVKYFINSSNFSTQFTV